MITIVGRIEFGGFVLVLMGFLTVGYMRSRLLTFGDVLARARTVRVLRIVLAVLRPWWLHRRNDPACRAPLAPKRRLAANPVAREHIESADHAPRIVDLSAAAGKPEPVVPSPRQAAASHRPAVDRATSRLEAQDPGTTGAHVGRDEMNDFLGIPESRCVIERSRFLT